MTDVTITGQDNVIFTFDPGEIATIGCTINGAVEQYNTTYEGPGNASGYQMEGPTAAIVMTGRLYETTNRLSSGSATTILEQIKWLMKNIRGNMVPKLFTSNYCSEMYTAAGFTPTKILWGQLTFTEMEERPEELAFTIQFIVAGRN